LFAFIKAAKLDSKQNLETWHAPWGYLGHLGLQTGIEFATLPGPEVGVARRFCALSAPGLPTFEKLSVFYWYLMRGPWCSLQRSLQRGPWRGAARGLARGATRGAARGTDHGAVCGAVCGPAHSTVSGSRMIPIKSSLDVKTAFSYAPGRHEGVWYAGAEMAQKRCATPTSGSSGDANSIPVCSPG
jgi:hypothetical protein